MDTKNIQSLFKLLSKIVIKCAANAIAPGNVLITTPLEELGQLGVDKLSNQLCLPLDRPKRWTNILHWKRAR